MSPVTTDVPGAADSEPGMVDGFPTSTAIDAVATGCALISSNPRGEDRVFRAGIEYLRVPEDDPAALVDALVQLRDDPGLRAALARKGRDRIEGLMPVVDGVAQKLAVMGLRAIPPQRDSGSA